MDLKTISKEIRKNVFRMVYTAGNGHIGCSLSDADIITVLFFSVMHYSPNSLSNDHFILSKGHASESLYCALALKGFFPEIDLMNYQNVSSLLSSHPTNKIPGIEFCTGALGHGMSIATGMAIGEKLKKTGKNVFCITGDGELQEGSNWEAIMAAAQFKLGNLVVTVDNNGIQLNDRISNVIEIQPLTEKFDSFGWDVIQANGNDVEDLKNKYRSIDYFSEKPHLIIAKTIKGCGVSFTENKAEWHHRIPSAEELDKALEELD